MFETVLVAVNFYVPFSWSSFGVIFGVIVLPSSAWRRYFPAVTKAKYLDVRPSSSAFITTQKLGKESKEVIKKYGRFGHTLAQQLKTKC